MNSAFLSPNRLCLNLKIFMSMRVLPAYMSAYPLN